MSSQAPYRLLGIALFTGGVAFTLLSVFVISYAPMTALGIATVILGVVSLSLSRTLPGVYLGAGQAFLEAGLDNIAALVEELGLRSKAIYLPAHITNGNPRALIPLDSKLTNPNMPQQLKQRLIVRFGQGPEHVGILVATPGSALLSMPELKGQLLTSDLEVVLSTVLTGILDLAKGIRVLVTDSSMVVEVDHPMLITRNHPAYQVLGSPIASIVATIAAQVFQRPIVVQSEGAEKDKLVIHLELLNGGTE